MMPALSSSLNKIVTGKESNSSSTGLFLFVVTYSEILAARFNQMFVCLLFFLKVAETVSGSRFLGFSLVLNDYHRACQIYRLYCLCPSSLR